MAVTIAEAFTVIPVIMGRAGAGSVPVTVVMHHTMTESNGSVVVGGSTLLRTSPVLRVPTSRAAGHAVCRHGRRERPPVTRSSTGWRPGRELASSRIWTYTSI